MKRHDHEKRCQAFILNGHPQRPVRMKLGDDHTV